MIKCIENILLFRCLIAVISCHTLTAQIVFEDVSAEAGIDHQYKVFEGLFGGAACVIDINGDGYEDLYITGGLVDDQLLFNNGDGTFTNIFIGSGLEITRKFVTLGVVSADVNRDGYPDLYITTSTRADTVLPIPQAINLLFLNNGDNSFRDVTADFKLDNHFAFSTGACFGDFNADGYPDLYVGNYFLDYDGPLTEISDATIVNASRTAPGALYINRDGKYFENVYGAYGLNHKGFGFGGVFTDYDNDGDQDLIVNHDFGYKAQPNYVLRNEYPRKKFSYVEEELGLDLRINAMGTAIGDVNEDGFMDFFFTNIKFNRFMISQGPGKPYIDQAKELGTHMFTISWGAHFADFDHDGDLDLYVVNGDLNPYCTAMSNYLFENINGKFLDISRAAGVNDYGMGRGSVVFDYDNDGDLDILVINQNAVRSYPDSTRTKLFRNNTISDGNWVRIKLVGQRSESRGIGARLIIKTGGRLQMRDIDGGGSSHLSQNSSIAHFGLGNAEKVDTIIIEWPGGQRQIIKDLSVNQLHTVEQSNFRLSGMHLRLRTSLYTLAIGGIAVLFYYLGGRRGRRRGR